MGPESTNSAAIQEYLSQFLASIIMHPFIFGNSRTIYTIIFFIKIGPPKNWGALCTGPDRTWSGAQGRACETYWAHEGSGILSVNSAYNFINASGSMMQNKKWSIIWKLEVPSKMRMLLWLITHGRVMCNAERKRRHMTCDDRCPACSMGLETIDHVP